MPTLHPLDVTLIVAWLVLALGAGLFYTKRAGRSMEAFFVADRSLPWWAIGTSMVATTFAVDTPLVVCGYIAAGGIAENWKWWFVVPGAMMTVFVFAKYWRRTGVLTEAELAELRYGGRGAAILRTTKALWYGVFLNVLVLAWVMRAMHRVIEVIFQLPPEGLWFGLPIGVVVVLTLFVLAVVYTMASGMWGVVVTDIAQFMLAMAGSVLVAGLAWSKAGGLSGIQEAFDERGLDWSATTQLIPLGDLSPDGETTQWIILLTITWWAARNVDGGSYLTQRLLSAKDPRHASWGYLWFTIANICLRPWPWIAVGLAGLALYGTSVPGEDLYPHVMLDVLPPGLFGLLVVSFLAAFMSTVDTHLHWGASLLVHDVYRRFIAPDKDERHHVLMSRLAIVGLAALGATTSFAIDQIRGAWELALAITAGIGAVNVARWLWWRVTAWSELTAMATALIGTLALKVLKAHHPDMTPDVPWLWLEALPSGWFRFPFDAAAIACVSVPLWVLVTYLGPQTPKATVERFYRLVRPGGPGWRAVANELGEPLEGSPLATLRGFVAGTLGIYGVLLGSGYLLIGQSGHATVGLAVGVFGLAYAVWRVHLEGQDSDYAT